jgi:hypothetical protein
MVAITNTLFGNSGYSLRVHFSKPVVQTYDNLRLRYMLKYAMLLITSIYTSDVEIKTNPIDSSSLSRKQHLHFWIQNVIHIVVLRNT